MVTYLRRINLRPGSPYPHDGGEKARLVTRAAQRSTDAPTLSGPRHHNGGPPAKPVPMPKPALPATTAQDPLLAQPQVCVPSASGQEQRRAGRSLSIRPVL
jgi:hypothetical protein